MFHPGMIDPSELLAKLESQILKAKEESLSRKDIMDRINKWISACDEEAWLEEYNQVFRADFFFRVKSSKCFHGPTHVYFSEKPVFRSLEKWHYISCRTQRGTVLEGVLT
jgi:hypothetical protein